MTRVLVVDDDAPIRLLCRVNLEAEGMEVLEASDGPTGGGMCSMVTNIRTAHHQRLR